MTGPDDPYTPEVFRRPSTIKEIAEALVIVRDDVRAEAIHYFSWPRPSSRRIDSAGRFATFSDWHFFAARARS
jgi:hypothetical protein